MSSKAKRRRVVIEVITPLSRTEFGKALLAIAQNSFGEHLSRVEISEDVGGCYFANHRTLYERV